MESKILADWQKNEGLMAYHFEILTIFLVSGHRNLSLELNPG
jgi:hypothetical protein